MHDGFGSGGNGLLLLYRGYGLARAGVVPETAPLFLGLPTAFASSFLPSALREEQAPFRHSLPHLTAQTLAGKRSVDITNTPVPREQLSDNRPWSPPIQEALCFPTNGHTMLRKSRPTHRCAATALRGTLPSANSSRWSRS